MSNKRYGICYMSSNDNKISINTMSYKVAYVIGIDKITTINEEMN